VQALLLPVGADRYALELVAIREVVVAPTVVPLPGAPATVLGVANLRGEVVPVFDTVALLGRGRLERLAFAAVAETEAGLAALAADGEPSMRQTAPGKRWTWVMENPAAERAARPELGSPGAHRVTTLEPKSTTTVTPDVPEHAAASAGAWPVSALPPRASAAAATSRTTTGPRDRILMRGLLVGGRARGRLPPRRAGERRAGPGPRPPTR